MRKKTRIVEVFQRLDKDRFDAWEQLQDIRLEAKKAETARDSLLPFERCFKVTIEQLIVLYDNPNWRHSVAYGGNAWKEITKQVLCLVDAMEKDQSDEVSELLEKLSEAEHNNGSVKDKLNDLDNSLKY
jgi:hypothetical protein|tara:strand:+ start:57 stop:443 length:387 start_codon:yes stop_codon:yes gene_type:complete